ncbi:MAG: transporter associated domain-containing protein, partial [Halovenus sp.]
VKDVLHATETSPDATAGELARDLLLVPETTRVDALLGEFQSDQSQIAAVIDEWGAMEGIVTVEDVVEVIVGDLRDTFDSPTAEPSVHTRTATKDGQTEYSADGALPVQRLNEELGTAFERSVYATVGGLVLDGLGEPAQAGDTVTVDGYEFEVDDVDGARIERVLIRPLEDAD